MIDVPDRELLSEFARNESEPAFAELVRRHIALVHSTALRHTDNPQHAQEITQAVFIILARKAASLGRGTVLSGWLYHTARLTAANARRAEFRRVRREQEVYMQSALEENSPDAAWLELVPLLDEAMARLGATDRDAVVLRYFENKSLSEVGATLGLEERAAQKRVNRALEKLRKFFNKRGVTLSATVIAGAVAANSVQAAPAGLAATVAATAAKGAVVGGSTLTIIKGTLKIMVYAKVKTAIVAGVVVLATGTATTVFVQKTAVKWNSVLEQRLDGGSLLTLNRVTYGDTGQMARGGKMTAWHWPGHEQLVVEFNLTGNGAVNHPLVARSAFFRQFRCVLRGEKGIEYVEEILLDKFEKYGNGYYGYVETSIIPRDSRWLWLRIEQRDDPKSYDSWRKVAEFKAANPAHPADLKWIAGSAPVSNIVNGMSFVLGEITVKTVPNLTNDIWNHVVNVPVEVWESGVLLTNWHPTYVQAADASGNWEYLSRFPAWRSLDPRYVWKLEMDFEPESDFPAESMVTVELPKPSSNITTNVGDVPVTISWAGGWLDATIPTNRADLAIKFVSVSNDQGDDIIDGGGSWGKFQFRKGDFMTRKGNMVNDGAKPTKVTLAIVPNVHATFYSQPRLVSEFGN